MMIYAKLIKQNEDSQLLAFNLLERWALSHADQGVLEAVKNFKLPIHKAILQNPNNIFWNAFLGLETNLHFYPEEDCYNRLICVPYVPSPVGIFAQAIDHVQPSTKDVFVDLGCGKGLIVNIMALLELKNIYGIEKHPYLADVCLLNNRNNPYKNTNITVINNDVQEFGDYYKEGTIFYIYHAFDQHTFYKVLENIEKGNNAQKDVTIMYCKPPYYVKNTLAAVGWLDKEKPIEDKEGMKISIWRKKF